MLDWAMNAMCLTDHRLDTRRDHDLGEVSLITDGSLVSDPPISVLEDSLLFGITSEPGDSGYEADAESSANSMVNVVCFDDLPDVDDGAVVINVVQMFTTEIVEEQVGENDVGNGNSSFILEAILDDGDSSSLAGSILEGGTEDEVVSTVMHVSVGVARAAPVDDELGVNLRQCRVRARRTT